MKLICINAARDARRPPAQRRAVAEIELMLVIIVILLPILFLMGGAWTIGRARLQATYDAENNAYAEVVSGNNITSYADDPVPPAGLLAVRPGLPNRFDSAHAAGNVTLNYGSMGTNTVGYNEKAIFLDPTWHWNTYPASAVGETDHSVIAEWFENYVGETKTPAIVSSLGLQPPGPP
jgi:hypothetical protein